MSQIAQISEYLWSSVKSVSERNFHLSGVSRWLIENSCATRHGQIIGGIETIINFKRIISVVPPEGSKTGQVFGTYVLHEE